MQSCFVTVHCVSFQVEILQRVQQAHKASEKCTEAVKAMLQRSAPLQFDQETLSHLLKIVVKEVDFSEFQPSSQKRNMLLKLLKV